MAFGNQTGDLAVHTRAMAPTPPPLPAHLLLTGAFEVHPTRLGLN